LTHVYVPSSKVSLKDTISLLPKDIANLVVDAKLKVLASVLSSIIIWSLSKEKSKLALYLSQSTGLLYLPHPPFLYFLVHTYKYGFSKVSSGISSCQ
jgi:hypothetical protein